jgi:hypothetical protein
MRPTPLELDESLFLELYPEFEDLVARFPVANAIANSLGGGWQGLDDTCAEIAHQLCVAHVLTMLADGSSPISEYETKESKEKLDTALRNKATLTSNFHLTDYGLLLLDIAYVDYVGVM